MYSILCSRKSFHTSAEDGERALFFDKILVDAPCSGEGMFRKNPDTISQWSESNVEMCANRQKEILEACKRNKIKVTQMILSDSDYSVKVKR